MITTAELDAAPIGSQVRNAITGVVIERYDYGWSYVGAEPDEQVIFDEFTEDHTREGDELFLAEVAA